MQYNTTKVSNAAMARVRDRLRDRPKLSVAGSIASQLPAPDSMKVAAIANELAALFGVDVEHLRPSDTLRDLQRVCRDELPADIQPLMARIGLKDVFDPLAFDLLDIVEKRMGQDRSRLLRAPFVPAPKSEEEWIDRILDMTVADFLSALS